MVSVRHCTDELVEGIMAPYVLAHDVDCAVRGAPSGGMDCAGFGIEGLVIVYCRCGTEDRSVVCTRSRGDPRKWAKGLFEILDTAQSTGRIGRPMPNSLPDARAHFICKRCEDRPCGM